MLAFHRCMSNGQKGRWRRRLTCLAACLVVFVVACSDAGRNGTVTLFQPCLCDDPTQRSDCTRANSCQSPLACDYLGFCVSRCTGNGSCAGDGTTCLDGQCVKTCTPVPSDSCPQGSFCALRYDQYTAAPVLTCFREARNTAYDDLMCSVASACPRGLTCRPASLTPCTGDTGCHYGGASCACAPGPPNVACEPWCRVGAADCPAGTRCVDVEPALVADGAKLGTCRTVCDPTEPCANGRSCVVDTVAGTAATDCIATSPVSGECSSSLDCLAGKACRVHAPGISACEAYCVLPGGRCPSGGTCTPFASPLIVDGLTYGSCTANCDLLSATSCGADATCAPVSDTVDGGTVTDCVPAGKGQGASGCTGPWNACVPGAHCVAVAGSHACETYCRAGHNEDCPPQFTCATLNPPLTVGGVTYGLCQDDCDLAAPADVCSANATCAPIVDGTNPPHTACVNDPCHNVLIGLDENDNPILECEAAATIPLGSSCDNGCPPGSTCRGEVCVAWCKLGPNGHCPGGTTCAALAPPLVVRGTEYGTCQ